MRLGPPGGPAAIQTRLGWTLQGPARDLPQRSRSQNCYLTSVNPETVELLRNEEKLWQVDTLPSKSDKQAKRSREDQEALQLLETKTIRVEHNNVQHYATPLLRKRGTSPYHATKDTVMPSLCGIEKRFAEDEDKASAYAAEMSKLELAGSVRKLTPEEAAQSEETSFIPNHLVEHNGKNRIVFNCSYQFQGRNLNKSLFPGPTLGPSLPGVLLRFREHAIAISGDIKAMFHQVCLLPEDKPLLPGVLLRFREHAIAISGDIKAMFHQVCLLPEDKPLLPGVLLRFREHAIAISGDIKAMFHMNSDNLNFFIENKCLSDAM